MAKNTVYTCSCMISCNQAEPVPLESLAPEQRDYANKRMTENIGKTMSRYFTQHPEEYINLKEHGG